MSTQNNISPYQIIRPKSHDAWLAERENGVGASEAGAVLGVSHYSSPYEVWEKKVHLSATNTESNWAMELGHIYEPYIASKFEQATGLKVIVASEGDWLAVSREHSFLRVSPDRTYWREGMVHNRFNKGILECKSSRLEISKENWREDRFEWNCQIQYQMYVMGYREAYLGFVNTQNGNFWYDKVEYDEEFVNKVLIPRLTDFWVNKVLPAREMLKEAATCSMAYDYAPTLTNANDYKMRYPKSDAEKQLKASEADIMVGEVPMTIYEAVEKIKILKSSIDELDASISEITDAIKIKMEDAESILDGENKSLVTYKSNKDSKKFDEKAFAKEHKELYEQYQITKQGARVFKVK